MYGVVFSFKMDSSSERVCLFSGVRLFSGIPTGERENMILDGQ